MKLLVMTVLMTSVVAVQFSQNIIPKAVMDLKGPAIADYVNGLKTTWHAEYNPKTTRRNLMDIKYTKRPEGVPYAEMPELAVYIPDTFDAREHWRNCKLIGKIRDQGECGSCWAVTAAETLSDRICIASNGQQTPELSADDLLACCTDNYGCNGGIPIYAWRYMRDVGIVTGSEVYEKAGCKPYSKEPCGTHIVNGVTHYHNCSDDDGSNTPICTFTCTNPAYTTPYKQDKHYAKSAYALPQSVKAIQTEILMNGPVHAGFITMEDFDHYKGGVYQWLTGNPTGAHSVKILGWGTDYSNEPPTPYWLIANSWNTDWGEDGFFRMIRGENNCGIEEAVVAGLAKV